MFKNRLIPIYRDKEIYTFFYDEKNNHLYRLIHRGINPLGYMILFFAVLYGSKYANEIYQPYEGLFFNLILFIIGNVICYLIAVNFYHRYYIWDTTQTVYLSQASMKDYSIKGEEQLHKEIYIAGGAFILFGFFGYLLFLTFGWFQAFSIGCIGSTGIYALLLMRPMTRRRLLRKFQRKEIQL